MCYSMHHNKKLLTVCEIRQIYAMQANAQHFATHVWNAMYLMSDVIQCTILRHTVYVLRDTCIAARSCSNQPAQRAGSATAACGD